MSDLELLKQMYKQIPKALLRNKWDLGFMMSKKEYNKVKDKLHNSRFMGIDVYCDYRVENDKMYLNSKQKNERT